MSVIIAPPEKKTHIIEFKDEEKTEVEVKPQKAKRVKKAPKIKIMFLCTGNTCRSAMAESVFRYEIKKRKLTSKFEVSSSGYTAVINEGINPSARAALAFLDIPWHKHKAKRFDEKNGAKQDLIVCMSREHKQGTSLKNAYTVGEITAKGDVPDPYGYPIESYIKVAKYLWESVDAVLDAAEYLREKKNKD